MNKKDLKDNVEKLTKYSDEVDILVEEYDLMLCDIVQLPEEAFHHLKGVKKLMDEGFSFDEIKELPEGAFHYPEGAKELKDEGFSFDEIKELPEGAFNNPENAKILIRDCNISIEKLKQLPDIMLSWTDANYIRELIKDYGVSIDDMSKWETENFDYLEFGYIQYLIKERGMPVSTFNSSCIRELEHEYTTTKLLDMGFSFNEIQQLPDKIFYDKEVEKLEKIIKDNNISLYDVNDLYNHFDIDGGLQNAIYLIKKYSISVADLMSYPDNVISYNPDNVEYLIDHCKIPVEELKFLPDVAFIYPDSVEYLIDICEIPIEELKYLSGADEGPYDHPRNVKYLIDECGIPIKDLKKLPVMELEFDSDMNPDPFKDPRYVKALIDECDIPASDIANLPKVFFFYSENVKYLINDCKIPLEGLKQLPNNEIADPSGLKKLIENSHISAKDLLELPTSAFIYPESIDILRYNFKYTLEQLKQLPNGAYEFPSSVKTWIDKGLSFEEIKELPDKAFDPKYEKFYMREDNDQKAKEVNPTDVHTHKNETNMDNKELDNRQQVSSINNLIDSQEHNDIITLDDDNDESSIGSGGLGSR